MTQDIYFRVNWVLLSKLSKWDERGIVYMVLLFFYVLFVFFDAVDFDLVVVVEGEAFGMGSFGRIGYEVFRIVGLFASDGCFYHGW